VRRSLLTTTLLAVLVAVVAAMIYGARAHLEPDTALYGRGEASWSSPVVALVGLLAGPSGVRTIAFVAAAALLTVVALRSSWSGLLAVALLPTGWSLMYAGADAAGALAALLFIRRLTLQRAAVVALFHLEAGLCYACAVVASRLGFRASSTIALVAGVAACVAQWHVQTRYLLPGVVMVAAGGSSERSERADEPPPPNLGVP
jgi:hypothetical protein